MGDDGGDRWRQWLLFFLVMAVTVGASVSYCRGDEGWRRPPSPTSTP